MAKKDVLKYYDQVANQFMEMQEELKNFTKECEEGLVAPEKVEQFKEMIAPLKRNYETLSYIVFLLNRPVKKEKHPEYVEKNKQLLERSITDEEVLQENEEVLKCLKQKR